MLIDVALGDHQVTNWHADVEARTIGASAHVPVLDPGRWPDDDVLCGVPRITSYPFTGSAIFYWDIRPGASRPGQPRQTIGVPPPPFGTCPTARARTRTARRAAPPLAEKLISGFLQPYGAVTNVCGGEPCHAGGWTGP